jgi:hypothetical protein
MDTNYLSTRRLPHPHPIAGFIGNLDERIDVKLVTEAARQLRVGSSFTWADLFTTGESGICKNFKRSPSRRRPCGTASAKAMDVS